MITIVDYGMGNLGSVANMLKKIGAKAQVTSDVEVIRDAQKIILPGVGSFDKAMQRIDDAGLREVLDQKALEDKVPTLGICLGMQLLTRGSKEGVLPGLGWIPADTLSFKTKFSELQHDNTYRVPHMGWNQVRVNSACPLTSEFEEGYRFYFVHSYYVKCDAEDNSMLKANYGFDFDAAIVKDNIYGMQFHPEKSHKYGMKVFDNFNSLV